MYFAKPVFTLIRWNIVRWPLSKKQQADSFMKSEVAQLCTSLWNPIDCSLSDSSIQKILQARVLDQVTISFSRGSSWAGTKLRSLTHITDRCFTLWATREACLIPWTLNYFTKAFLGLKSRMSLCSAGRSDAAAIQLSQGKWLLFDVLLQFQVHKNTSPSVSKLCKFIISRTQSIYPWILTPVFVFTLMRVKLLSARKSKKEQAVCFSQKTEIVDETGCYKEGENAPVCFFCQVGDCKYSRFFIWWKCCFLFRHPVLGSEKLSPQLWKCAKTLLDHIGPFIHLESTQGGMFCEFFCPSCCYPEGVKLHCQMTL